MRTNIETINYTFQKIEVYLGKKHMNIYRKDGLYSPRNSAAVPSQFSGMEEEGKSTNLSSKPITLSGDKGSVEEEDVGTTPPPKNKVDSEGVSPVQ